MHHLIFSLASLLCIPNCCLTGNSAPGRRQLQTGNGLRNFFHTGTGFARRDNAGEIFTTAGLTRQDVPHLGGAAGSALCCSHQRATGSRVPPCCSACCCWRLCSRAGLCQPPGPRMAKAPAGGRISLRSRLLSHGRRGLTPHSTGTCGYPCGYFDRRSGGGLQAQAACADAGRSLLSALPSKGT